VKNLRIFNFLLLSHVLKIARLFFAEFQSIKNIFLLIIENLFPLMVQGNFNFCKMTLKLLKINLNF
jgi:hypothetical protein